MRRIAVVGAGVAGACLVEQLAARVARPCELTVVDGAPVLWRGRAYQPDDADVITNIAAAHMSVRPGDPSHAERWLRARGPGVLDASGLTSRALYGVYLAETLSLTAGRLVDAGWRLRVVREYARGLEPAGESVRVVTAGGRGERFDHVVLCAGPAAPPDPYGLAGVPGWVAVPFPLARTLAAVPADAHVGVLGSGLTAVDIVAGLVARGHRGPIALASRGGVLPSAGAAPAPHPPRHLTLPRLESLAAGRPLTASGLRTLLRAELRSAGVGEEVFHRELALTEPPVDRLRRQLADAAGGGVALAVLRQALHRFAGQAWNLLPEAEQTALWRCHGRAVTSLCCPMPRHRAELMLRLLTSGRLTVLAGLSAVEPGRRGGLDLIARGATCPVDVLFNALNPGAPGDGRAGPVEATLAARCGAAHPLGGLRTDRRTHRVPGVGGAHTGLHALGHPTRGAVLFHFGLPSLVHQSGLVARAVAAGVVSAEARRPRRATRPGTTG
ncbi:FAD/NAD(P)-binding protein [Streptomyces sp. I05A-00742]|uniref:FAD/NAD(P)-binding protein n=1 Tax=Streptomyces sp. I05A-00742 TaxID=2732853 RepID=UPI001487B853|nr:FAD/NAD(P)-binding protein [Streptomyces sp. I05A-00742]